MEPLAVGLDHRDPVVLSLEYLHLVHREDVRPGEISLPGHEDGAVKHVQRHCLVDVSVLNTNRNSSYSFNHQLMDKTP